MSEETREETRELEVVEEGAEVAPETRPPVTSMILHPVAAGPSFASGVAAWQPSALAELSEEDFQHRLVMAARERDRIAQIQRAVMREDVDYGLIPGTKKPTIFKPGCEILDKLAGYIPTYPQILKTVGNGVTAPVISYQVKCYLVRGDGSLVAEGDGSANTWEEKYRYRYVDRSCPDCGETTVLRSKRDDEFFCWKKKGGCGSTFALTDKRITGQSEGRIENPDQYALDNTILKMAKKRARSDATLTAHAASSIFTQDAEDLPSQGGAQREGPKDEDGEDDLEAANRAAQAASESRVPATKPAPPPAALRPAQQPLPANRASRPSGEVASFKKRSQLLRELALKGVTSTDKIAAWIEERIGERVAVASLSETDVDGLLAQLGGK